jgi:hypothetical protein
MIRGHAKVQALYISPDLALDLNPLSESPNSVRVLRGLIPERGRLIITPYKPVGAINYATTQPTSDWHIVNFRYTRASAAENKIIHFANTGRVYEEHADSQIEIFPANTTFAVLTKRPFVGQLGNRLFFSDGVFSYVFDGRSVRRWGLTRSTTAPTVSAVAAGSLTAAIGLKACITWVVLDEASNRVHESSRSNVSAFQILAAENLRVDITALTPPSGTTHWSAYVSELNGSNIYRRSVTTAIGTLTVDVSSLPAATSPKVPTRNDPPPPSTVGCVAKNRIFLRDDANPNRFYFSALGEVEGLLNGSGPESFCGYSTNSVSDIVNSDTLAREREIRAMTEHENDVYAFSESSGYIFVGDLNLLDSRSPRSLVKYQQFSEGCISAYAVKSTPYGITWMSPGKKLWLFNGNQEALNIGEPIQPSLDAITGDDTKNVFFHWWNGNGRQWLMAGFFYYPTDSSASGTRWRSISCYDFSRPSTRQTGNVDPGSWFELSLETAAHGDFAAATVISEDGQQFLYTSEIANGQITDSRFEPATIGVDNVGECYVNANAGPFSNDSGNAEVRTQILAPNGDSWTIGHYAEAIFGIETGPGTPATGTFTIPVINSWIDPENADTPGTGIALTFDTEQSSADRRAWLQPQSAGNTNVGGAFGKRFLFQILFSRDNTSAGSLGGQVHGRWDALYKVALHWSPQKETTL